MDGDAGHRRRVVFCARTRASSEAGEREQPTRHPSPTAPAGLRARRLAAAPLSSVLAGRRGRGGVGIHLGQSIQYRRVGSAAMGAAVLEITGDRQRYGNIGADHGYLRSHVGLELIDGDHRRRAGPRSGSEDPACADS